MRGHAARARRAGVRQDAVRAGGRTGARQGAQGRGRGSVEIVEDSCK